MKLRVIGILGILAGTALFNTGCPSKNNSPTTPPAPTDTPSPAVSTTPTNSTTPTQTATPTGTPTKTSTPTATHTPVNSATPTPTATITQTPTLTPSSTPTSTSSPSVMISTLAGTQGVTTGLSSFYYPMGVALDGSGGVYVADSSHFQVKDVSSGGIVSLVAGSGTQNNQYDFANGAATTATFCSPAGVVVDGSGDVLVSDSCNCGIREIAGGNVSTFAGVVFPCSSAPNLNGPQGIAIDGSGNVYEADLVNNNIEEISGGTVSTIAASSNFVHPYAVAVNSAGTTVYVADEGSNLIKTVVSGAVSTYAGRLGYTGADNGAAVTATFNGPEGIAVDGAGNVYVADTYNDLIREITPAGTVSTLAGLALVQGAVNGSAVSATFNNPIGVAVNSAGTTVFVADYGDDLIREIQVP